MLVDEIARLAAEVHQNSEDAQTEITSFPSGAVSLPIRVGGRAFELVYLPRLRRFGLDELEGDAGFESGYRFGFQDFEAARAKLLGLLEEARVVPACEQ